MQNTNTTNGDAAVVVTGNPVNKSMIRAALTSAFDDVKAVEKELDDVAHDVAGWLEKEFHIIPKTVEEKAAAQNADAASSTTGEAGATASSANTSAAVKAS